MPEKFNSKNLSYASKPPPFLAALQAQAAGHGGPDPISAGRRRLGKKRSDSEEAEDVPLVVDEHGNTLALEVDKDGAVAAGQHDDTKEGDAASKEAEGNADSKVAESKGEVNVKASIGGRKRKAGRIVGNGEEKETGRETVVKGNMDEGDEKDKTGVKKPKKKAKMIKLSFDED